MRPRPSRALALATTILLLTTSAWSLHRLRGQSDDAHRAAQEWAACRLLAQRITSLKDRPAMAGIGDMQLDDMARLIEQAVAEATLQREQLVRIWPEPARRMGDTPYLEKNTQVLLRDASLEQLVRFLVAAAATPSPDGSGPSADIRGDRELVITSLRMTAPRSDHGSGRWTAEIVFSYLIYAPAPAPGSPGSPGSPRHRDKADRTGGDQLARARTMP